MTNTVQSKSTTKYSGAKSPNFVCTLMESELMVTNKETDLGCPGWVANKIKSQQLRKM